MESMLRSPIYSHFQSTLQGAQSIRAFRVQRQFERHSDFLVDRNQRMYFAQTISFRLALHSSRQLPFQSLFAYLKLK